VLSDDERAALMALIRPTAQARQVLRARIVLSAAEGATNTSIAADLAVCVDTVRKWRSRFVARGLAGLADGQRPGRPRRFTPVQQAHVTAIACELPATRGMPLSRWSSFELAMEAIEAGVVVDISASTVRRWLASDALKPWQYRSWIAPRAPDFAAKAATVLDLYARIWDGQPLGPGDYVLCSDEKTSIQARCRCHPTLPPGVARMMRVEHEYQRGGALAYLAAWDVYRGKVFGRCEPSTGIAPFSRLVQQVMTREPYYPVHASWLNQCEIYFSIVQRKVVTPNDFYDLADVQARLMAFQDLYNLAARPFNWKYTKKDLDALLHRLAAHEAGPLPAAA
jgi:transposase